MILRNFVYLIPFNWITGVVYYQTCTHSDRQCPFKGTFIFVDDYCKISPWDNFHLHRFLQLLSTKFMVEGFNEFIIWFTTNVKHTFLIPSMNHCLPLFYVLWHTTTKEISSPRISLELPEDSRYSWKVLKYSRFNKSITIILQ